MLRLSRLNSDTEVADCASITGEAAGPETCGGRPSAAGLAVVGRRSGCRIAVLSVEDIAGVSRAPVRHRPDAGRSSQDVMSRAKRLTGNKPVVLKRVALKRIQATRFRSFCLMHVVAAKPKSLLRDMH